MSEQIFQGLNVIYWVVGVIYAVVLFLLPFFVWRISRDVRDMLGHMDRFAKQNTQMTDALHTHLKEHAALYHRYDDDRRYYENVRRDRIREEHEQDLRDFPRDH